MDPHLEGSTPEKVKTLYKYDNTAQIQKKYRVSTTLVLTFIYVCTLYTVVFRIHEIKFCTIIYGIILSILAILGSFAGPHRLWSHRSYEAAWPLKLFLFCCYTLCCHVSIYDWARLHRLHHKYTDTDADPHNSNRGFFFAHIGWIMMYRTEECRKQLKKIDMSDVLKDPFVTFYSRYYLTVNIIMTFLPCLMPIFLWREDPFLSFLATAILRLFIVLHCVCSVNSFAHMYGYKPYNRSIKPTETALVSFFSLGEGWHNYHHTFPWDYKAAEFGDRFNLTARFLDLCAKLGLAYDLKTVSPNIITKTKERNGDKSFGDCKN